MTAIVTLFLGNWRLLAAAAVLAALGWWHTAQVHKAAQAATAATHLHYSKVLGDISAKTAASARTARAAEDTVRQAITAIDQQATQEVQRVHTDMAQLRRDLVNRTRVVRVPGAICPTATDLPAHAGAGSLGTATVELDPAAGQRAADLHESVRIDQQKLSYLQVYAQQCHQLTTSAPHAQTP